MPNGSPLPKDYFDPIPGPGLDDNAYTAFNQKVMALYNDTSKIEYGAMPLLLQRWARYQGLGSKEEYENNQKIRLVLAQKKVLEENKYFFDVQNWLMADRRPAVLPNRMGEPNLSDFLHEYFNDPTYQFDKQQYPDTLYKVGKIVAKLEAVEGKLVPCPTPVADTPKTATPVAADPLQNSALSAPSGGEYTSQPALKDDTSQPGLNDYTSQPASKSVSTLTGLSGTPIKTTCDPLTKTELLEGFPIINVMLAFNPKGKAAWDKIPDINQPEEAYADIDKQIDDLANLAFSAINDADNTASQEVTVDGAPTPPPAKIDPKPVVEESTIQKALGLNVSQLGGMNPTQIIKQLVRGKLTPEQNQTIRVMLAQLQVLYSDKNVKAMQEVTSAIPKDVDQTELFKQLGQGIPDNIFDNVGHAFGTTDLSQHLQPLIDAAKQNLPNLSVPLDIDKINTFINGVIADVQAIKPVPCTGPKCDDPQPAALAPLTFPVHVSSRTRSTCSF